MNLAERIAKVRSESKILIEKFCTDWQEALDQSESRFCDMIEELTRYGVDAIPIMISDIPYDGVSKIGKVMRKKFPGVEWCSNSRVMNSKDLYVYWLEWGSNTIHIISEDTLRIMSQYGFKPTIISRGIFSESCAFNETRSVSENVAHFQRNGFAVSETCGSEMQRSSKEAVSEN